MNILNGFLTTTGLILVQILYVLTQNCHRGKIYFDSHDVYCEGATSTNVLNGVQAKKNVFYLKFINCNFRSIDRNFLHGFTRLIMLLMNGSGILQIEPYAFSNLNHLYSLNLSSNLLTEIPDKAFDGSSNIGTLDLSYNKLTHISFKLFVEIKNLTYLNISHNDLIALNDMTTLPKPVYIDTTYNKIAKMDFKDINFQIETFNLNLVDYETLIVYEEYSILELNAKLLKIQEITEGVRGMTKKFSMGRISTTFLINLPMLKTLYLDNFYKEFSIKFSKTQQYSQEQGMLTLYYFWNTAHYKKESDVMLSGNYSEKEIINIYIDNVVNLTLRNMNSSQFSLEVINKLENLESLDLSHNQIVSISGNLTLGKLKTFKVSENDIKQISFQFETPMLEHLSLDSLQLTAFSFDILKNSKTLVTLDLSNNQITSIYGTAFSNNLTDISFMIPFIRKINLSNNRLSSINNIIFNTTELLLEYNEITDIANSQPIFNALTLHLGNNKISSIAIGAFGYLNKLQYLNLSHNMITDLQIGAFTGLNELISLDLSYNNIEDLKYTSIQVFSKLKYLNIASNKLSDIVYSLGLLQSLDTLSADNNSFNCFTLHRILKHLLQRRKVQIIGNNEQSQTNIFGIHCTEESTIANDQNNNKYPKMQNYESSKETLVNTNKNEIYPQHMDATNKIFVTLITLVVLLIIFAAFIIMRSKLFSLFRIYYSKRENESENIEFM